MANNEFKQFATFETLITPKIITVVYWAITLMLIVGSIISWVQGNEGFTVGFAIFLVVLRIMFELIMVSFKNNEYLRRIAEAVSTHDVDKKVITTSEETVNTADENVLGSQR